jgi:hypothetical protein
MPTSCALVQTHLVFGYCPVGINRACDKLAAISVKIVLMLVEELEFEMQVLEPPEAE